jgi:hypothetical protein
MGDTTGIFGGSGMIGVGIKANSFDSATSLFIEAQHTKTMRG